MKKNTIIGKMTALDCAHMFERKIGGMSSKINAMSALGDTRAKECATRAFIQIARIEKFYKNRGPRATTSDEKTVLISILEDIQECYNTIVILWNSYSC